MQISQKKAPFFTMLAGAVMISFSSILVKAITLTPSTVAFYRFFFGMISLTLLVLFSKKSFEKEAWKKAWPYVTLAGLFFALDMWTWHRSIVYVGAGTSTLLANTQIFYLVLIGWIFFKEKPSPIFFPAMLITIAGIILLSYPNINFEMLDKGTLGVIYGLLTGIIYAMLTTFLRQGAKHFSAGSPLPILGVTTVASIAMFFTSLGEGNFAFPQGKNLIYSIIYGGIVHCFGWLCVSKAIIHLPLAVTSLLLLLQPILSTVMGNIIYDEPISFWQFIGIVLALSGIYLVSFFRKNS